MIVYKVVFVNQEISGFTSAIPGRGGYQQIYVPGEVTRAKLGWLFAFRSIEEAKAAVVNRYTEVWAARTTCCEAIVFVPGDGTYDEEQHILSERFEAFWQRGVIFGRPMKAPLGTVICPELTLLHKV